MVDWLPTNWVICLNGPAAPGPWDHYSERHCPLPIFDGGVRVANVDLARAGYDEAVADYRQHVLVSVREVEDSLSSLRLKSEQAKHLFDAASSAGKAAHLSNLRYREGESDYLEITQTQA